MGFSRNLKAVRDRRSGARNDYFSRDRQPTNIVFMGMGEPLMNWKAVDPTLSILNDEDGFGIGARHITVSTVGVLPGIVALGRATRAVPSCDLDSRTDGRASRTR